MPEKEALGFIREPDGIVLNHWDAVSRMVRRAMAGDGTGFSREYLNIAESDYGKTGQLNALYIYGELLTGYALDDLCEAPLERSKLLEVARRLKPLFLRIWPNNDVPHKSVLERSLLSAAGLDVGAERKPEFKMVPPMLAALGAVLADSHGSLDALRPRLGAWCLENKSAFKNLIV